MAPANLDTDPDYRGYTNHSRARRFLSASGIPAQRQHQRAQLSPGSVCSWDPLKQLTVAKNLVIRNRGTESDFGPDALEPDCGAVREAIENPHRFHLQNKFGSRSYLLLPLAAHLHQHSAMIRRTNAEWHPIR